MPFACSARAAPLVGEHVRMAADHLGGDALDHVAEAECALLLGHARMIDDLQKEVAELVLQPRHIAARNRIGHLIGFLQRIGRDGLEILLQVPGAAAAGRPQRGHDLDEAADVAGRFHVGVLEAGEGPVQGPAWGGARTLAKPAPHRDCPQRVWHSRAPACGHRIRIRHIMEYL